ncbi:hypothetical protein MHI27_11825 [Paenibacillus sp. FSL H8-0261]|uniref:hypothetical protein n=1 Tax=Paenibacillus sp. FSL H8-0261 TaxID=2921381 RepID=UPI0032564003
MDAFKYQPGFGPDNLNKLDILHTILIEIPPKHQIDVDCGFHGERENTTCIYSLQSGAKIWQLNKNDRVTHTGGSYSIPIFHMVNYSSDITMSILITAWHKISPSTSPWYQSKNVVFSHMDLSALINNNLVIYNPTFLIVGDGNRDIQLNAYEIRITDPSRS